VRGINLEGAEETSSNQWTEGGGGRVLIVDDHLMLAEALALGLSSAGCAVEIAELVEVAAHARRFHPDLVILDLDLGAADGLDLVAELRSGGAAVLVVTGCTDECRLAAAVALGAAGWVSKSEPFERILGAADTVLWRGSLLSLALQQELTARGRVWLEQVRERRSRMRQLTNREREVLTAMQGGHSAVDIADQFVVSVGTVRTHIQAVLMKLGVSTQLAAVAVANHPAPATGLQSTGMGSRSRSRG
jgi:DNA-binding NarL/FixJ family response regulator